MSTEINDQNFSSIIKSNKVVVVDFTATWCGPCKALAPIIEQLYQEYNGKAIIGKLDVDKSPVTTAQFGVRNVPVLLFFKNGQMVDRMVGGGQKSAIESKINSLM